MCVAEQVNGRLCAARHFREGDKAFVRPLAHARLGDMGFQRQEGFNIHQLGKVVEIGSRGQTALALVGLGEVGQHDEVEGLVVVLVEGRIAVDGRDDILFAGVDSVPQRVGIGLAPCILAREEHEVVVVVAREEVPA